MGKLNDWRQLVKQTYHSGVASNKNYTFRQALKDASRIKGKHKGTTHKAHKKGRKRRGGAEGDTPVAEGDDATADPVAEAKTEEPVAEVKTDEPVADNSEQNTESQPTSSEQDTSSEPAATPDAAAAAAAGGRRRRRGRKTKKCRKHSRRGRKHNRKSRR